MVKQKKKKSDHEEKSRKISQKASLLQNLKLLQVTWLEKNVKYKPII